MTLSFEEIKELKVGDTFYEEFHGFKFKQVVTQAPVEETITINGVSSQSLSWKGRGKGGEIDFRITEGYEHYGPVIQK